MARPTRYARAATFNGVVSAFSTKLDPQLWAPKAPEIWDASHLIDTGGDPSAANGLAPSWQPKLRNGQPPQIAGGTAWNPPGLGLFFEQVKFAGFTYRNVLTTRYMDDSKSPTRPRIRFEYAQYDCLDTNSSQPADGGVDVDHGFSDCVEVGPGRIKVSIAKTVRFTQPKYCRGEVNALLSVMVPLTFDSWLYDLIFP